MKKLLSLLLCLALCLSCAPAHAAAEPETASSGDYEYVRLPGGGAEITKYTGGAESLEIPAELDGLAVASIGAGAFADCNSLRSVTIPDGVVALGDGAFQGCEHMSFLTIPDSLVSVGANPLSGCESLTRLLLSPDNPALAVIDGVLFSKADRRLVNYPWAFTDPSWQIPQGIASIGSYAFFWNGYLTSVTIPDSVHAIEEGAFYACHRLESVVIPDGVTSIGDEAFFDCGRLTSVTIPDSVASIGEDAFSECPKLTLTVGRGSFAAQYCKDNGLLYTYPDANDWLKG